MKPLNCQECEVEPQEDEQIIVIDNRIYLFGELTVKRAEGVLAALDVLGKTDDIEDVEMLIHSEGGDFGTCCSIVDAMRFCPKKIKTIGTGVVASGAVPILASGTLGERTVYPNTLLLLHQPYLVMAGKVDLNHTRSWEKNTTLLYDMYSRLFEGKVNPEQLEQIKACINDDEDVYFDTPKIVELGIADKILGDN